MHRWLGSVMLAVSLLALSAGPAAAAPQTVNITGKWHFTTNYGGGSYGQFTLTFVQHGTKLSGHDGTNERITGSVQGSTVKFHVHTGISEDDYGGTTTLSSTGTAMAGSFWIGFGFSGTCKAKKIS